MHFLGAVERPYPLGRPRAAVMVASEERGARLVIDDEYGIVVARADALFYPLPDHCKVFRDGKEIKPSKGKRFWVSTETFDPYHMILEAEFLPL